MPTPPWPQPVHCMKESCKKRCCWCAPARQPGTWLSNGSTICVQILLYRLCQQETLGIWSASLSLSTPPVSTTSRYYMQHGCWLYTPGELASRNVTRLHGAAHQATCVLSISAYVYVGAIRSWQPSVTVWQCPSHSVQHANKSCTVTLLHSTLNRR